MSIEQIKQSENQLSKLDRLGRGEAAVCGIIAEAENFIRIELNEDQVRATARMIVSEFWYLKLEDLVEIFRLGMRSKQYGGWNFQTFCEWVIAYENQKIELLEAHHMQEKANHTKDDISISEVLSHYKKATEGDIPKERESLIEKRKSANKAISWAEIEKEKQKLKE